MPKQKKEAAIYRGGEIAVIGMAGRFPGADTIAQFWENLKNGVESITFFTDEQLERVGIPRDVLDNPNYVKAKGALGDYDHFDADFFSYPPREVERMDPQLRILHECSWEAFENAGYNPESYKGSIGAYLGANDNMEWIQRVSALSANYADNVDQFLINYRDYVSTRISYKLNLHGPSFTLLSACSTSLVAIHLACQALRSGECDLAIAGGVSIMFPEISGYLYQEGLMLSSDGHCRAFDEKADGTVFGDGAGVVILKRLDLALKDRDCIHAVIRGSAVNNDGSGKQGFTTPSIEGQRMVIEAAHRSAGVKSEEIAYVETHGTGTKAGDPIEFEALRKAFNTKKKNFCGIGSVKTNIGHVNVAAGVSSFIKTILALEHRQIPPSLHYESPNPGLDIANSPFYVNNKLVPWKSNRKPAIAGVSAFGFGGTNAHIILQEAPRRKEIEAARPQQLIAISAKTESALQSASQNLAEYMKQHPEINFADVAYTLNSGRKHFDFRRSVVAGNAAEAMEMLAAVNSSTHAIKKNGSVVFMFPGQGSQYVGMGEELYQCEPLFRSHVDQASGIFKKLLKTDIRDYLIPRKKHQQKLESAITHTNVAQPAIFTYSYALAKLLMSWGIQPSALIGHSLGEIVAACVAGIISLEDALYLVAQRGKLMQKLPGGVMLAVPLSEEEIQPYLGSEISLAAINAPALCVVSGNTGALKQLKSILRQKEIPGQYLATSHAFHSYMMDPVLEEFYQCGKHIYFNSPSVPIVSSLTGDWIKNSEMKTMAYWSNNIRQTVRFSDGVAKLLGETDAILLEVGPGKTLANLTKMQGVTAKSRGIFSTSNGTNNQETQVADLLSTVGKLWESGVSIDWEKFYGNELRSRLPLPAYPFERRKYGAASPVAVQNRISSWSQLTKKKDIAEWIYTPSWKKTSPPYLDLSIASEKNCWLILTDTCGIGESIRKKLAGSGQDVVVVRPGKNFEECSESEFVLNPGMRDDYERLFVRLNSLGKLPQRILHLWTLTKNNQQEIPRESAEDFQSLSFFSLLFLSQVIGGQNITHDVRIAVVSNNLHDTLGNEEIIPDKATILGPIKVIPQEYPSIHCCNIDVILPDDGRESNARIVDQILREAITNSLEPVVAYRDDNRWIQTFDRVRLDSSLQKKSWLREGGTYLITGGLGGLGLVIAEFFAKEVKAKLILTGRSEFPAKDQWENWLNAHAPDDAVSVKIRTLLDFEKAGAEVYVITADVTDRDTMSAEIAKAMGRFGTIHGVIHAAGIHGEGVIQLKKDNIAKGILAPKIKGTIILDEILKGMDLDFFVLCSSIASFLGGIGLVDYCAANAYMDAYVTQKRFRSTETMLSINWDMWGEVGMGLKTQMPDELKEWLAKELRDGITSSEGTDVLQRILTWRRSKNVIVSTRDLQARVDLWIKREFIKEKESLMEDENTQPKYMRPNLSSDYAAPENEIEAKIAAMLGKLFGFEKVGRNDSFYELGGHSLLATTLVSKLKKEFNVSLSIRDILDHPVLSELAGFIRSKREEKANTETAS